MCVCVSLCRWLQSDKEIETVIETEIETVIVTERNRDRDAHRYIEEEREMLTLLGYKMTYFIYTLKFQHS